MRNRRPYRVCRCTPSDGIVHLEARLLHDMINAQIHPLCCAKSCRWKYKRGLLLGDLCASAGHPWWAMKVWCLTLALICEKDWADWRYEWINPEWVRIDYVLSETECLTLGRRIDNLWCKLGHPEKVGMETMAKKEYDDFWYDKYDYDRNYYEQLFDFELKEYETDNATAALFREGQGCDI